MKKEERVTVGKWDFTPTAVGLFKRALGGHKMARGGKALFLWKTLFYFKKRKTHKSQKGMDRVQGLIEVKVRKISQSNCSRMLL